MRTDLLINDPHIVVEALAGTGKTFTVTNGVNQLHGYHNPKVTGSEEQEAIWNEMAKGSPGRIHMTSFSRDAANQLAEKCIKGVSSGSTYSLGLQICKRFGLASNHRAMKKYEGLLADSFGMPFIVAWRKMPGAFEAAQS